MSPDPEPAHRVRFRLRWFVLTQPRGFEDKVALIWSVGDLLRGESKAHEYGRSCSPLTILRRLECDLEPTKAKVIAQETSLRAARCRTLTRSSNTPRGSGSTSSPCAI